VYITTDQRSAQRHPLLHCALSLAVQSIIIGPVCGFVCLCVFVYFGCVATEQNSSGWQIICCCRTTDMEQSAGRSAPSWQLCSL